MKRRNRFFKGHGEKRKYCNNVRYFGGTRNISLAVLGLMPAAGFIGVLAMFAFAAFLMMGSAHEVAAQHGKLGVSLAFAAAVVVPDFKGLMSLQQKAADLIRANETLVDKAEAEDRDFTAEEQATYNANDTALKAISARIDRIQGLQSAQVNLGKKPVTAANNPGGSVQVLDKPGFKSLGEQLRAVAVHEQTRGQQSDPRLIAIGSEQHKKMVAAATGANEAIPAEGGWLVQADYQAGLLQRTYDSGQILKLTNRTSISSNRLVINGIDEQSRANGSRFGGMQSFWANEADTITASKPKFRRVELILNKLTAAFFATDELLDDAAALESEINDVVPQELAFRIEDGIFNGPGNGQPFGFMNAPALIVVAKEAAQAANTVVAANIMKMWSRMWAKCRQNGVWLYDQSIEPQLFQMTITTGTGISTPIYMPPGGLSGSPYGTLFGRPMMATEYNASLTNQGDIVFADLSQYKVADKGAIQAASSMHVNFLKDEMCFRFTQRLDGQPLWNTALTPKNGGPTLSPFITLQNR